MHTPSTGASRANWAVGTLMMILLVWQPIGWISYKQTLRHVPSVRIAYASAIVSLVPLQQVSKVIYQKVASLPHAHLCNSIYLCIHPYLILGETL